MKNYAVTLRFSGGPDVTVKPVEATSLPGSIAAVLEDYPSLVECLEVLFGSLKSAASEEVGA